MSSISQADTAAPHLTLVSSNPGPRRIAAESFEPLAFVQAVHRSLNLETVLDTLNRFLGNLVGHSGWVYRHATQDISLEGGEPDRHRLEYDLTLNGREMGTLVLMRGRRFSDADQETIEGLLRLAAPALSNALHYQALLTELERDPLTGLGNRLAFHREGAHWLADAERQQRELSLMVLDLDGFKAINDQFGHLEGDRLLIAVAGALRAATRASDLCVRLGGDEFLVLLPSTDLGHAMECAERIRHAIVTSSIVTDSGVALCVRTSIGVACHRPGMTLEQLYCQADEALYAAKRAGRNRIMAA